MRIDMDQINQCPPAEFVATLGGIFEHSPWVAEAVVGERPFGSREQLHRSMCAAVTRAAEERRLALLRAHPELAGREAKSDSLTDASKREQRGAGLDQCSADELAQIAALNRGYRDRFEFPFIIAVTGLDRFQIIAAMQQRLGNERPAELDTALGEVEKIARIRIDALIDD